MLPHPIKASYSQPYVRSCMGIDMCYTGTVMTLIFNVVSSRHQFITVLVISLRVNYFSSTKLECVVSCVLSCIGWFSNNQGPVYGIFEIGMASVHSRMPHCCSICSPEGLFQPICDTHSGANYSLLPLFLDSLFVVCECTLAFGADC